jgi:hypothetical protein
MDHGDHWWLAATTPQGVHVYEFGVEETDTAEERSAIIAAIRGRLGFPDDEGIIGSGGVWELVFAPGRPERFFAVADVDGVRTWVPRDGVTVGTLPPAG